MNHKSYQHFSIGAVSLLLIDLVLAMPAEADFFTCRASALRIALPFALVIEPVAANPADTPCAADAKSLLSFSTLGISAGMLNATTIFSNTAPVVAKGNATNLILFNVLGLVNATVGTLHAKARVDSVGGVCVLSSRSSIAGANVLGMPIILLTTPRDIPILNVLSIQVATLHLNATIGGPNPTIGPVNPMSVTQRALWLQVNPGLPLLGLTDVIVGEATADITGLGACGGGGSHP